MKISFLRDKNRLIAKNLYSYRMISIPNPCREVNIFLNFEHPERPVFRIGYRIPYSIGSVDPDPEGQKLPTTKKNEKKFRVLKRWCSLWKAGNFSCSFKALKGTVS
jgi:hypothetical protein